MSFEALGEPRRCGERWLLSPGSSRGGSPQTPQGRFEMRQMRSMFFHSCSASGEATSQPRSM